MKKNNFHPFTFPGKNLILFIFSNLLVVITLLCFISCSHSQPTQPPAAKDRITAWDEDIDYLSAQLTAKQINLFGLIPEATFNRKIKAIKDSVYNLKDYEIIIKLQQLIASLGVGHTTMAFFTSNNLSKTFHYLPLSTYYFPDGLYILSATEQYTNLLGKKILGINGIDISIIYDSLKTIISHENDYHLKNNFPGYLTFVELLKYFGFINSLTKVNVEVEGIGETEVTTIQSGIFINIFKSILDGLSLPLYMQNSSSNYWYTYISNNDALYVKYNVCENMSTQSFSDFTNGIQNFMTNHTVNKFIIDVRNNGGGSDIIINPLFTFLQSSTLNQKGKLFVIIGRQTFSSAVSNAVLFKFNTNCVLVGEPTGGKPNSYGEVSLFTLPNSRIEVQYSTKFIQVLSNEDPISLFPDNDVEISMQDYAQGKDAVLDFILNY